MVGETRFHEALLRLGEELTTRAAARGGPAALGERHDLEPAFVAALAPFFPGRVEKDRGVSIPSWDGVGRVDVIVKASDRSGTDDLEAAVELKWGKLDEAPWDLFKMALLATREDAPSTYLLTAAPADAWAANVGADIFASAIHTPGDLCRLRYSTGNKRAVWDWLLEGGYGRFPARVPAQIRTILEGAITVGDADREWEVRLVRVIVEGDAFVEFSAGWPDGDRPADARYPSSSALESPVSAVGVRNTISPAARITGCLLGGALGDALGAPVEFMSLDQIRREFGSDGIADLAPAYGRVGAITDDTQMTLFTAEGLIRAHNRWIGKGISHVPTVVHHAYLRWLHTQGETGEAVEKFRGFSEIWPDGWLVGVDALHDRRAPGNTCLSALHAPEMGTIERPLNDSKGCGAVMRAAPAGLMQFDHFQIGAETGAITHGHPSGYLPAGFLAHVIGRLARGGDLREAIAEATELLAPHGGADETRTAVERAIDLAGRGDPNAQKVESLGAGWVGEEALAISLYCALVADGFEDGVRLAVNHGGDSDSTGAITGNLLGAMLGTEALPERWLAHLELREEIGRLAADLVLHNDPAPTDDSGSAEPIEWERYPGW